MGYFDQRDPYVLDRKKAEMRAKAEMGAAYHVLSRTVDAGLHIARYISERPDYDRHMSEVLLILLRIYLQALDASDTLLRSGAADAANITARTALETGLQGLFLAQRNDERYACAYLLSAYRKLVNDMARGNKQLSQVIGRPPEGMTQTLTQDVERIEQSSPEMIEAARALNRLEAPERWFSAFGGPKSLRRLALEVSQLHLYEDAYLRASRYVHAGDIVTSLSMDGFKPLRQCDNYISTIVVQDLLGISLPWYRSLWTYYGAAENPNFVAWLAKTSQAMGMIRQLPTS